MTSRLTLDAPELTAPWKKPPEPPQPIAPAQPAPPPEKPKGHRGKKAAHGVPVVNNGTNAGTNVPAQEVEIVNNGTLAIQVMDNGTRVPTPMPFQPISPIEIMAAANPHVLSVMVRQIRDMKGIQPDTSNGALKVMVDLTQGFKTGSDITPCLEEVAIHLTGRTERRELITALTEVLDDERMTEIFRSRSKFEDFLHSCQRRSDVNVMEGIAIQGYFNNELDKIYNNRARKNSSENSTTYEPQELVNKANLPTQLHRKELQYKFNDASPQEREILRKLGFRVQNMVAARLTKTTTETIELVQKDDSSNKPGV